MTNRMETGIMKIERVHRKRSAPNDRLWNNRPSLVARGGYFRLLRFCKIKMKIESIWHLFARILLADFLRYFRKILENPQRIFSVFPFISQKIWLRNLHTTRCQIGSFIQHCTKQKTPSKSSQSLPPGSRIRPPNTYYVPVPMHSDCYYTTSCRKLSSQKYAKNPVCPLTNRMETGIMKIERAYQ